MPFNIPSFGFGGGSMEFGSIFARVGADLSDFDRGMAAAAAKMRATAAAMKTSGNSIGSDAEKAGKRVKAGMKDAEKGLNDFDKAATFLEKHLSGGPFGLFSGISNVGQAVLKLGGFAEKAAQGFSTWAMTGDQASGMLGQLGMMAGQTAPMLGALVTGAVALGAALLVLPGLAAAATFALVFLLDAVTTLAAVVGGLVAPLSLTLGLLGGLGAAFAYVAQKSFTSNVSLSAQHQALLKLHIAQQTYNSDLAKYGAHATQTENALIALQKAQDAYKTGQEGVALGALHLQDKIQHLVGTLSNDFRPEILRLGEAAATALTYLDKVAHMPLAQAFKSLSSQGVHLLNQFVTGVGGVLARPFRLAIQFGFGTQNVKNAVTGWWTSFTNYLFGYSKTQQIKIGFGRVLLEQKNVKGALQPIIDWFNHQHFTQTGIRWSNEIINGFINSGGASKLSTWAGTAGSHAGHMAGRAFMAAMAWEILNALPNLLGWMHDRFVQESIWQEGEMSRAWQSIVNTAERWWNELVSFIESPLTVHISWPSPPSWLSSALHGNLPGPSLNPLSYVHPATGGLIKGGIPGRDSVPALLTPGELVLNSEQQQQILNGGGRSGRETLSMRLRSARGVRLTIPEYQLRGLFEADAGYTARQA